jgi:tetratricopeptide (TPR) repeat protein
MKYYYSFLVCCCFSLSLYGQSASSLYKAAKKSLEKFQQGEAEKLEDAFQSVELMIPLLQDMEAKKAAKYWLKAGEVYNEVALGDYKQFLIYNDHKPQHPMASFKAADALIFTVKHADKKWDSKLALDELIKTTTFITNEGIAFYNIEAFESAYQSFQRVDEIRETLNKNGHNTILAKPDENQQHLYRMALAAKRANKTEKSISLFEQLEEIKFNNPLVYSSLYELYIVSDEKSKARNILQDGRELFPASKALQIAEINWYMSEGELPALVNKLKEALDTDPTNISFYISLGHIYDQMQHESAKQGDFQSAQDHFNEAKYYFTRALDVDDQHAPALYNLGALYYNKAAVITQELKALERDLSVENVRTIVAKQSEMATLLEKALPFFQKAEAIDPNDIETLTALKEIYSRKDDPAMAEQFAERLSKVEAGENLSESVF